MNKKRMYTMIIGCGRLGAGLASKLSEEGEDVMVVDMDKTSFRRLSPSYGGQTMVAAATDISKLISAEVNHVDTLITVTNHDNINICAAQMGKMMFKIPRVIARVYDSDKEVLLKPLQIDTICPVALSEKEIAHFINWEGKHYEKQA